MNFDYFLDKFLLITHLFIIFFNLFGWIPKITRKYNLALLTLTMLSWFGLGFFYGLGYCPCTDFHYQVKIRLGEVNLPHSYIQYLLTNYLNLSLSDTLVDVLTFTFFFTAFLCSLVVNFFPKKFLKNPFQKR